MSVGLLRGILLDVTRGLATEALGIDERIVIAGQALTRYASRADRIASPAAISRELSARGVGIPSNQVSRSVRALKGIRQARDPSVRNMEIARARQFLRSNARPIPIRDIPVRFEEPELAPGHIRYFFSTDLEEIRTVGGRRVTTSVLPSRGIFADLPDNVSIDEARRIAMQQFQERYPNFNPARQPQFRGAVRNFKFRGSRRVGAS